MSNTFTYKGRTVEIRTVIQVRIDGVLVDDQFVTVRSAKKEVKHIIDAEANS